MKSDVNLLCIFLCQHKILWIFLGLNEIVFVNVCQIISNVHIYILSIEHL